VTLKLDKSSVKGGGLRWQQTKAAKNQRNKKKKSLFALSPLEAACFVVIATRFQRKKKKRAAL
jgi:hypothetical protein